MRNRPLLKNEEKSSDGRPRAAHRARGRPLQRGRAAFFLPLSAVVVFLFCVLVHVLYDIVSDFSNDYSILRFYNVKEKIAEVESSSVFCSARGQ